MGVRCNVQGAGGRSFPEPIKRAFVRSAAGGSCKSVSIGSRPNRPSDRATRLLPRNWCFPARDAGVWRIADFPRISNSPHTGLEVIELKEDYEISTARSWARAVAMRTADRHRRTLRW